MNIPQNTFWLTVTTWPGGAAEFQRTELSLSLTAIKMKKDTKRDESFRVKPRRYADDGLVFAPALTVV